MYAQLKLASLAQFLAFSLTLCVFAPSTQLRADSYQLTTIKHTQSENFIGIDASGNFSIDVLDSFSFPGSNCGGTINPGSCFETFYSGLSSPVFTTSAPPLVFDNGSPCKPAVGSAFGDVKGICNNGHFIISAVHSFSPKSEFKGIWGGPDPDVFADLLGSGIIASGFMNSNGDAVFINSLNDTLVFALDLSSKASTSSTPEPSSFLLLGTGTVCLLGALKRRFSI